MIGPQQQDKWAPGDLALHIGNPSPEVTAQTGLRPGGVYLVEGVVVSPREGVGLVLQGCTPRPFARLRAFAAAKFRKVTPPAVDEFDREVIEAMKGKRVPSGVEA